MMILIFIIMIMMVIIMIMMRLLMLLMMILMLLLSDQPERVGAEKVEGRGGGESGGQNPHQEVYNSQ